jgi:phosphopantothenoylcysteine decarboxylase
VLCVFNISSEPDEEWREWQRIGDPVLHIELRNWADVLLVSPLSAHCLAKFSHGLCDDTLSCVVRAWEFRSSHTIGNEAVVVGQRAKPFILAPAMNTAMWEHPLTREQLATIKGFGQQNQGNKDKERNNRVVVVDPQVKLLACGDVGNGAMAAIEEIILSVRAVLE